jgi:hypothetical protein
LIRPKTLRLKNRSPRTRFSKPSLNLLPRRKANRTLHQKSKVWARVKRRIQSLQRQLERHFWEEEKAIAPVVYCTGGLCSRGSLEWSVAGGVLGRGCRCSCQVGKSTWGKGHTFGTSRARRETVVQNVPGGGGSNRWVAVALGLLGRLPERFKLAPN